MVQRSPFWDELLRKIVQQLSPPGPTTESPIVQFEQAKLSELVSLGLEMFSMDSLEKYSGKDLLVLVEGLKDRQQQLCEVIPDEQFDADQERLKIAIQQVNKALALRGKLPSKAAARRTVDSKPIGRQAIEEADLSRTSIKEAQRFPSQNSGKTAEAEEGAAERGSSATPQTVVTKAGDRSGLVDAYISKVMVETGEKISRRDICFVAGYRNPTEFQRWQRSDPRTTPTAVANFKRVLEMEPKDFLRNLEKIKARKSALR